MWLRLAGELAECFDHCASFTFLFPHLGNKHASLFFFGFVIQTLNVHLSCKYFVVYLETTSADFSQYPDAPPFPCLSDRQNPDFNPKPALARNTEAIF
jgi:hypothetical protein